MLLSQLIRDPDWYKLYLVGVGEAEPWGDSVGGTMFAVIRGDPNFPRVPSPDEPSGQAGDQKITLREIEVYGGQMISGKSLVRY